LDFRRAAMSQVEWGPSMETANGTRQNVNGGKLETSGEQHPGARNRSELRYPFLEHEPRQWKLFTKTFGDKVGFRYYEDECRGIFWSNDPHMTIHQMAESLHQLEEQVQMQHDREIYRAAGVPDY